MPAWVTSGFAETSEDVAFLSGVALGHMDLVTRREDVPQALLRARLALAAAEVCVGFSGRVERAAELRDAVQFLQPGDTAGPAGEIYQSWARAVERPVSVATLDRALPSVEAMDIGELLDVGQGLPLVRAARVLEAALGVRPQDPGGAIILAEAVLAQSLGWRHLVPVLSLGLERDALRKTGEGLRQACYRAVLKSVVHVEREAAELARRAARLRTVAPKLRAKGADQAVELFLSHDALAPTALKSLRSGRAARRFCDRLVELGVVRELTGRDTFRLYGV